MPRDSLITSENDSKPISMLLHILQSFYDGNTLILCGWDDTSRLDLQAFTGKKSNFYTNINMFIRENVDIGKYSLVK